MFVSADLSTPQKTGNVFIDSLLWDTALVPGIRITYVLQGVAGDGPFGGTTWSALGARSSFAAAAATWAAVANLTFEEAAGPYNGTGPTGDYDWIESFEKLDDSLFGQHDLPALGVALGNFNSTDGVFTAASMMPGGDGFSTFIHEIGHGLGLLHPHNDEEDPVGDIAFPGVKTSDDLGSNTLNQGVYTVMTYNDGYAEVGWSSSIGWGWAMTPMAFDIAAVQHIYGANTATATGNDTYLLPGANAAGTGWLSIWDAGGADTISAGTTTYDAIIDLRAATLLNEPGGGGFVSRVTGITGGLTIANGVVIENALGGSGDDRIHGNAAANRIDGGAGYDTVDYSGVSAALVIDLAAGSASGDGADVLIGIEAAIGGSGADRLVAAAPQTVSAASVDLFKRAQDAIDTRQTALRLDGNFAVRTGDARIPGDPSLASVTVHAAGGGAVDYYSFTAPDADKIFIDIDNSFAADTLVRLFDAEGNIVAANDDVEITDPGSANVLDSYLSTVGLVPGRTYFIAVSDYGGAPLPVGSSYDLRVAISAGAQTTTNVPRGSMLDGGAGKDVLVGGAGNDWLIGGSGEDTIEGRGGDDRIDGGEGDDTAVFAGASGSYQVTANADGSLRIAGGGEGVDQLFGVERLRFANGLFRWDAALGRLVAQGGAPVVDPAQAIVVAEDGSANVTVRATDPENDPLTCSVTTLPAHGSVTGGANGAFVYTPAANFNGTDRFDVAVRDPSGGVSLQAVSVTVTPVNDAPVLATASQSLSVAGGSSKAFTVAASDVDGDSLAFASGAPAHGAVTALVQGGFSYAPAAGYVGADTFLVTVSDSRGGTVTQRIDVTVTGPPGPAGLSAYLADGFVGGIGGTGKVLGTNRVQDVTLFDRPGTLVLDASFNRGGDVIRLTGAAAAYRVAQSGSAALITDADGSVSIPVGPAGSILLFADGARVLSFDAASVMQLGSQVVTGTAQTIVAAAQSGIALPAVDPAALAKVYLEPGAQLEIAGTALVFGTSAREEVTWRSGNLNLDASFNRGGDVLHLGQPGAQFLAYRDGSSVVLVNGSSHIAVPLGDAGISLDFAGDLRTARIDPLTNRFLIGGQEIDAIAASPEPLGTAASLSLAAIGPQGAEAVRSDGNFTV